MDEYRRPEDRHNRSDRGRFRQVPQVRASPDDVYPEGTDRSFPRRIEPRNQGKTRYGTARKDRRNATVFRFPVDIDEKDLRRFRGLIRIDRVHVGIGGEGGEIDAGDRR